MSRNLESLKITGNDLTFVFCLDECICNIPEVDLTNCQISTFQYNLLVNNFKKSKIKKLTMCGVFGYGFRGLINTIKNKERMIKTWNKQGIIKLQFNGKGKPNFKTLMIHFFFNWTQPAWSMASLTGITKGGPV